LPPFPSPANPAVWVAFLLGVDSEVEVRIYDVAGNLVWALGLGNLARGAYVSPARAARWNGRSTTGKRLASGTYVVEVTAGHTASARRRILVLK